MGGFTRYLRFVRSLLTSGPLIYRKGRLCLLGGVVINYFHLQMFVVYYAGIMIVEEIEFNSGGLNTLLQ